MDFSIKKNAEVINFMESDRAIVYMILMEKEKKNLSYADLAHKLKQMNFPWAEQFGGIVPSLQEKIRQSLHNKTPDPELLKNLCAILEIEDNLNSRIRAYRFRNKIHDQASKRGRVSAAEQKLRAQVYDIIKENVEDSNRTTIEEAIISGGEDVFYEGELVDRSLYEGSMIEEQEAELIDKILLIHTQYPEMLTEFLEHFKFEK